MNGVVKIECEVTCPICSRSRWMTMTTGIQSYFYHCDVCFNLIMPKYGECCIFCSYGSAKCVQILKREISILKTKRKQ